MTAIQTFQNSSFKVQCVCIDGEPWFRATDVATISGYTSTAAINGFDDGDAKTLGELFAPSCRSSPNRTCWVPCNNNPTPTTRSAELSVEASWTTASLT